MSDEGGGGPGFDTPLDDLFVQRASIKEPSAAEREAEAKAARLADVRSLRDRRRSNRRARWRRGLRPVLLVVLLVALTAAVYKLFPAHKSSATAVPNLPQHVTEYKLFPSHTSSSTTLPKLPYHVTVYYGVPSDAQPDPTFPEAIRHDVGVAQNWLASQTNGRVLRVDERGGSVTVQEHKLNATTQELANEQDAAGLVSDEFVPSNGSDLTTIPLVFVPVKRQTVGDVTDCGVTGNGVAIVWAGSCGLRPSLNSAWPGGDTRVIVHE